MREEKRSSHGRTVVEIFPFEDDSHTNIIVSQEVDIRTMKIGAPEINWSCIGYVSPERAGLFATGLGRAIEVAKELEANIGKPAFE